MKKLIRKNYAIDCYRYFFAFFICTLHFKEYFGNPYPFGGAYLAVEFYLIVSGFFLLMSIDQHYSTKDNVEMQTWAFAISRFKRFFPQYILSWILLALYCVLSRHVVTFKQLIIDYPAEMFMLQMIGVGPRLNAAMWYVSALFLVSIVIFYLVNRNRNLFIYILAPLGVLLLYSYYYQKRGMLAGIGWESSLIVREGFWRALAGVCLGCIVYELYRRYAVQIVQRYVIVRTIYELGLLVLLSIMFYREGCTVKDFTLVFLMAIFVLSVMCGSENEGSYLTRLLSHIRVSGEYAYAIYCNHWLVNYFIRDYFPGRSFYPMLCIYLVLVVLMSIITTKFIKLLKSQFERKFRMKGKI